MMSRCCLLQASAWLWGNAHPELKKVAALITEGVHGAGVAEAVQYLKERGEIR